jgi:glycosyltransferase involved in cell wall biosynthesis
VPHLKAVESLLHSFLSSLHVLTQHADVVYFLDPANAPFCALLRVLGKRVVIHTDGLGWKRRKWGPLARRYYKMVEWVCARSATALVSDNPVMQRYYRQEYGVDSAYIPYGAESHYGLDDSVFKDFGIEPHRYLLVVARLEPENNTDLVIREYTKTNLSMPLVVVGDSPYDSNFMARLRALADRRVIFAGRLSDQPKLNALSAGAYVYIHGHEVGGTNPSLLRALHAGTAPVVLNISFNTAVIGETGYVFNKDAGNLARVLERLAREPAEVIQAGERAKARAQVHFNWDAVAREHARVFRAIAREHPRLIEATVEDKHRHYPD